MVVVRESEFLSLLSKARQDHLSNLIPQITALYDCPDYHTLKTRTNPVTCRKIFLAIAAGTTRAWLQKSITQKDILGGFANRFVFVPGAPKPAIPYPPPVDGAAWERFLADLNGIREWAKSESLGGQLRPTQETISLFSEWYKDFHIQAGGEGLLPALSVRMQDFAWKLAILYAASEKSGQIEVRHLEPALAVVDWQRNAIREIFADFSTTGRELEEEVVNRLRDAPEKRLADRDLYRGLKIEASKLAHVYDGLTRMGIVRPVTISLSGSRKGIKGHRLVDV